MSNSSFSTRFLAVSAAALLVSLSGWAQATTPEEIATAPAPASTPAKLPYGVEDVLKLSRAKVNEDVILSFVHNSGTIYNLSPTDIVYLKEHGVSDRVLNEMLTQRDRVPRIAAPTPTAEEANAAAEASSTANPQPAPVYDQPPAQTQPAPSASGPSSIYVIPYPTPARPYYYGYYYPYYGPYYYGYYGPAFRYGYGHGWHYSYWHGGHWHH
jgi:hypothetical protein